MATPRESITTVNGKRCTRSRARFVTTPAVISETSAVVTPTEVTTSTVVQEAPQIPTSSINPSAPPPLSSPEVPIASSPAEQSVLTPTIAPAVSSAPGTGNAVLFPGPPSNPLTIPVSTVQGADPGDTAPTTKTSTVPSQVAVIITVSLTSLTPISDTVETAVPSSSVVLSLVPSEPTVPTSSPIKTSIVALPGLPSQSDTSSQPSSTGTSVAEPPQQITNSVAPGLPTGGQVGVVAPEHSSGRGNGISSTGIKTIIGGSVGGAVGLALLGALLFFCLRRRKAKEQNWDEKKGEGSSFAPLVATKAKDDNSRPTDYPYERHVQHPSVSSVYSTQPHSRSGSELQGVYAIHGIVSTSHTSSESERRRSRKEPSVISSQYTFPSVAEDPVGQTSNGNENPFADPGLSANTQSFDSDLNRPLAPQPAAMAPSRDPFASLVEEIEGAPNWLRDSAWTNHKRTQSSASALNSHPPSLVYSTPNGPFMNATDVRPLPNQPFLPTRTRPPSNSYSGYPTFNTNTTPASRDTDSVFFGEPGPSRPATRTFTPVPSRPGTNMFTPGRTVRQSDPFDLDRPEVLGFRGAMSRMISVRKQPTRSRRTSSVGNWANMNDPPYAQVGKDGPGPGRSNR